MCSHYEAPTPAQLLDTFGIAPDGQYKLDLWPGYGGPFIRNRVGDIEEGDNSAEALVGVFGLLPHWAKDSKLARRTYNARSETVGELPSFRSAWAKARNCIIPAAAIFEPDWRSGKAVPTRISRKDGRLLGIAGLWEEMRDGNGDVVHSYTMLTINADDHSLMSQFHRPGMSEGWWSSYLLGLSGIGSAPLPSRVGISRQYPADRLVAESSSSKP